MRFWQSLPGDFLEKPSTLLCPGKAVCLVYEVKPVALDHLCLTSSRLHGIASADSVALPVRVQRPANITLVSKVAVFFSMCKVRAPAEFRLHASKYLIVQHGIQWVNTAAQDPLHAYCDVHKGAFKIRCCGKAQF